MCLFRFQWPLWRGISTGFVLLIEICCARTQAGLLAIFMEPLLLMRAELELHLPVVDKSGKLFVRLNWYPTDEPALPLPPPLTAVRAARLLT